MLKRFSLLLSLLLSLTAPVLAGIDEGWAALEAGDYETALREFAPLAAAGDADAQNGIGDMYFAGQGVPQDFVIAAMWYRRAADQGLAWGQQNLGWMYESGTGLPQDYTQAAHWFGLAAKQGLGWGQYSLANLYREGHGVPQNFAAAARLYQLAADQSVSWAQLNLGELYEAGEGVPQDSGKALELYRLAAAQGLAEAEANIAALAETSDTEPEHGTSPAVETAVAQEITELPVRPEDGASSTPEMATAAQVRLALLIGNSDYSSAPLSNPKTDIGLVQATLEGMGFEVLAIADADIAAFDAAVTEFVAKADDADIALFYFAGHGFALNDGIVVRNYLLSTSADVTATSDRIIRASGIPLDEIVDQISAAAKVSLFFVDACRNDPRVSRGDGVGRGLAPVSGRGNEVFIGVSTRIGETAADGPPGEGSPFARAFAREMAAPGLRVDDAFTRVRLAVFAETGTQQPEIVRDDLSAPSTIVLAGSP